MEGKYLLFVCVAVKGALCHKITHLYASLNPFMERHLIFLNSLVRSTLVHEGTRYDFIQHLRTIHHHAYVTPQAGAALCRRSRPGGRPVHPLSLPIRGNYSSLQHRYLNPVRALCLHAANNPSPRLFPQEQYSRIGAYPVQ
ncbi:hypothetical protein TRVL_10021 [Trypanosoma vivax]|nr:hypothetical protein TRVL_10021 [Trypanosoma vivax]